MAEMGEALEDALLFALDDLRGENFKRFKNKLRFLATEHIAWSRLEGADSVDTVQLLIEAYGKEGAREVAIEVLRAVNLHDSATRLQQWKCNDCRKKYRRHVQEVFEGIPAWGSCSGPVGSLSRRYTELLLLEKTHSSERACKQLMAMDRMHGEEVAHPEASPVVGMEGLFGTDAEGQRSRTVVLLGCAGVGKTTALQKLMLDWASGKLWQGRFEYVFYISCGALSLSREPVSVTDLLLKSCSPGTLLAEDVLRNQRSVLLLLDGFDEMNCGGLPRDTLSSDQHKKQAPANVVWGLLKRKLLPKSHLVVAASPRALQSLQLTLRSPRIVEVLGFCPAQRREYFQHFFEDREEEATRALESARGNEALFSLCSLPVMCWILCSICQETSSHRDTLREIPETATVTEVHMRLLFSLLGHHHRPTMLEGVCSLAKDGVLRQAVAFNEDALKGHGLDQSDLETLSANGRVLHRDAHPAATYRFTLFSFQEFFAALFYFVCADGRAAAPLKGLGEILGKKKESRRDCSLLVRFLFGLSNPRRLEALQKTWGCKVFEPVQQELLRWVEKGIKQQPFTRGDQLLELCHCIYETEDLELAKRIMGQVHTLDLQDQLSTKSDVAALSFCLSASEGHHLLRLSGCVLETTGLHQLLRGLLKSSEIQLNCCGLRADACQVLSSVLETNHSLAVLDLGGNPLNDLGVIYLCDGLNHMCCKLHSLRLQSCNLTAAACEHLSLVLGSSRHLIELDLQQNHLGDVGARKLCEGLKHPHSRLQRLMLHTCSLTAAACEDLASVLESSESLLELGLGDNKLGDGGIRRLCTVLGKPHCKLQRLALTMSFLSPTTKKKLNAVCAAHPGLILTSYYPPNFLAFPGQE